MKLKDVIDKIKLGTRDTIRVYYRQPSKTERQYIYDYSSVKDYYECSVNDYKEVPVKWFDLIGNEGTCIVHSIEIDYDQVQLVKESKRRKIK